VTEAVVLFDPVLIVLLALVRVGAIRAPGIVPLLRLLALRLVSPVPLPECVPVNELLALLNVTAFE
jgi:hypothetical protein